ncbi:TlpA family protein disulfide reductase [Gelatiniphilus marinus]|uniref:TlpA family protein disulfide reductase n=1 Tax=Gelatiniphilus marinus TaxID=1759464 RepID=A0ABW5JUK1_9FLAO
MNKSIKTPTRIGIYLFMFFMGISYAQESKSNNIALPESVFGEWYNDSGNNEYNGLLIHRGFIEYNYRALMYQDIRKDNNGIINFDAKDMQGHTVSHQLEVLTKDSIKLKAGDYPFITYVKHKDPLQAKRVTISDVPNAIKKRWFTTDGKNNLEFTVENENITFRNKTYGIEEIVHFRPNQTGEYRFIVKNENDYWMFYFKNWDKHYLQVGFNGKFGDLYKADKDYPDYRIDNMSAYLNSKMPKALRGNWLKADGSNAWAFSFYYDNAILDKAIWNYKSVTKKGKLYTITLQQNGTEKTMYAKLNKDKTASFGTHKKALVTYSTSLLNNPNLKLANDEIYKEETLFKADSATYSGIIRGFTAQSKEKTGMVHVGNVFTGKQESHLVKIQDDGRFSVTFPMYYPQQVYVRFPNYNASVFVEPGKETWQFLNPNTPSQGLFAGDNAQLNTDFYSLLFIVRDRSFYTDVARHVDELSLETYKEKCFAFYNRQIKKRDSVINTRFLSNKTRQVFDLELGYNLYQNILSYDIYSKDRNSSKIDRDYISFITPEIYNNKLAVVSSGYSSFINRLKFLDFTRKGISVTHPNTIELAELLKSENIALTDEEKEWVAFYKKYNEENATALKKLKDFSEKNQDVLNGIGRKIGSVYQKMTEAERKEVFVGSNFKFENLNTFIKSKNLDITFSDEEIAVQNANKNVLTQEEKDRVAIIHSPENNKRNRAFLKKYKTQVDAYVSNEFIRIQKEQIKEIFGTNFSSELMIAQDILGSISRNFIPLTDAELKASQKQVEHPFIANVIKIENDAMKAKIEANKSKTDFVLNETPKTEADNIFDVIVSKYKGKVVFIDFWATWCGPCRSGIKKMKPLKEELKDKDLVFVYITNPSSPEKTYKNMIPDIKGEHYRVSQDEWNYLASKFKITGIPHYTLVNKKGEVVKDKIYFASAMDSFKKLFEEELEK